MQKIKAAWTVLFFMSILALVACTVVDAPRIKALNVSDSIQKDGLNFSRSDEASSIKNELEHKNTKGFGGVWINPITDKIMIGATPDADISFKKDTSLLAAKYKVDNSIQYAIVKYDYQELKNKRQQVLDNLSKILSNSSKTYTVGLDPSINKVIVGTPLKAEQSQSEANFINELQNNGIVKISPLKGEFTPASCNSWFCDSPLRGGVEIRSYFSQFPFPDGYDKCTSGFGVMGDSGTKYLLTAGHCQEPTNSYWKTLGSNGVIRNIGSVHRNVWLEGTHVDAMIINTDNLGTWNASGKVYVRSGVGLGGYSAPSVNEEYDITGFGTSGSLVGDRVCASGVTSATYGQGTSCGPVKEVLVGVLSRSTSEGGGYWDGIVRAELCIRKGDSGGPVFRANKALGLITAVPDAYEGCSEYAYYTGMQPILNAFNNTIHVY